MRPTFIKLLGDKIKVIWSTKRIHELEVEGEIEANLLFGSSRNWPLEVWITMRDDMPEHREKSTLFHEVIHHVAWKFLPEEADLTEGQVSQLAEGLWHLFSVNPKLREYFWG